MRLTIAYSKIKKRNLVLINNATYRRETLSERPIRQPLSKFKDICLTYDNNNIEIVDKFKYLGVVFYPHLSWTEHVNYNCLLIFLNVLV